MPVTITGRVVSWTYVTPAGVYLHGQVTFKMARARIANNGVILVPDAGILGVVGNDGQLNVMLPCADPTTYPDAIWTYLVTEQLIHPADPNYRNRGTYRIYVSAGGGPAALDELITVPGTTMLRGTSGRGIAGITSVGSNAVVTFTDGTITTFALPGGVGNDGDEDWVTGHGPPPDSGFPGQHYLDLDTGNVYDYTPDPV